jgi:hypothetical protein
MSLQIFVLRAAKTYVLISEDEKLLRCASFDSRPTGPPGTQLINVIVEMPFNVSVFPFFFFFFFKPDLYWVWLNLKRSTVQSRPIY